MNNKKQKDRFRNIQHPLFGISFKNWIHLVKNNGYIDLPYLDRAAFITLGSLLTFPARLYFNTHIKPKIDRYTMNKDPVIIIGHWRSGTTYLHELLSQDPQFCYVSLMNTMLPDSFLLFDSSRQFLSNFLPKTRPMDNIEVHIDGPYEEEAGLAVLSPYSFFHALHFPRNAEKQYLKSIHFFGLTESEKQQWKEMYDTFMKTIVYANNGKQLLLKDPANTARIPLLLDLYPNAKFIHIYRNPYKVYVSTIKMRNKVLEKLALQKGDSVEIKKQVINNYKRLMKSYFEQKDLIPEQNLVEIRYEDLVKNPVGQVQEIYSKLQIPSITKAIPTMKRYLERKKNYKTNVYTIDQEIISHVRNEWNFTIDRWNYQPP